MKTIAITSDTEIPIFSAMDDASPFSQCCMKTYRKNNFSSEEILLISVYLERDVLLKIWLEQG